jgi:hypothetical protein
MTTKYCINCKYVILGENSNEELGHLCGHPQMLSLVTCSAKTQCKVERGSLIGASKEVYPCGKEGHLYEPKN